MGHLIERVLLSVVLLCGACSVKKQLDISEPGQDYFRSILASHDIEPAVQLSWQF